ncbi:MAG: class I SAM-dependent methyltransferase [Bacteroidota bacterium]
MTSPSPFYQHKPEDYYRHARTDILAFLGDIEGQSILELGAGGGFTLAYAKTVGRAAYVAGVELFDLPHTAQREAALDEFHWVDLNQAPVALQCSQFDILLCPDILEHLVDPWRTLRQWSTYLKPGGRLLISIPNIREISVMWKIWGLGDFGYTEDGILDKTHLRFFARRNAAEIPNQDQYSNIKVIPAMAYQKGPRFRPILSRMTLGWADDFLTHQWFVTATRR